MTANDLTQFSLKLLRLNNYKVWRQSAQTVKGRKNIITPGISDIIGFDQRGKFFAAEIKIGADRLSEAQKEFLESVTKAGGTAAVIKTPEDIEALLKCKIV